ncbi:MAG TPA: right-handed parallel beta-helix repeat-containing protein, partial [Spirochaetota bacterium]|nr:right-handed parallel beta-helix repeat-containing protein [Spirochaetota bacterium]
GYSTVCRNLFRDATGRGIFFDGNGFVINNTFFNLQTGAYYNGGTTVSNFNNIFLSNTGYALWDASWSDQTNDFNLFYGNYGTVTNTHSPANFYIGNSNIYTESPLLNSAFEISAAASGAVDKGKIFSGLSDIYQGFAPDIGWKESPYTSWVASNTNTGNTYATIQAAVNAANNNETIVVAAGVHTEQVTVNGINGLSIISWPFFLTGDRNACQLDASGNPAYGFDINNSDDFLLQGFSVCNAPSCGIFIQNDADNVSIISNNIYSNNPNTAATSGLRWNIGSHCDNGRVIGNDIWANDRNIWNQSSSGFVVSNNIIHDTGTGGSGKTGLLIGDNLTNCVVTHNEVYNCAGNGLIIWDTGSCISNSIINNTCYSNGQAIYLAGSDDTLVANNVCYSNIRGIVSGWEDSTGLRITSNSCYSNFEAGIKLESGAISAIAIYKNDVFANSNGIRVTDADRNFIYSNNIYENSYGGITVSGNAGTNLFYNNNLPQNNIGVIVTGDNADYNYISNNTINTSTLHGILCESADNTEIWSNNISSNSGHGIRVMEGANGAEATYIYGNEIYENSDSGIFVGASLFPYIYRNLIRDNNAQGIILSNGANLGIVGNNTILANAGDGVYLMGNAVDEFYNNIFVSNSGWGVNNVGSGSPDVSYSLFHDNTSGSTNGDLDPTSTVFYSGDPLLDSAYAIGSSNSPAVDSGKILSPITDGYNGSAPDLGWIESLFGGSGIIYNPTNLTATAVDFGTNSLNWELNRTNNTLSVYVSTNGTITSNSISNALILTNGLPGNTSNYTHLICDLFSAGTPSFYYAVLEDIASGGGGYLLMSNNNIDYNWYSLGYNGTVDDAFIDCTGTTSVDFYLKNVTGTCDWSRMQFYIKSSWNTYVLANGVDNYATVSNDWTFISIPAADFGSPDWSKVQRVGWRENTGGTGVCSFGWDEIVFTGAGVTWYGDSHNGNGEADTAELWIHSRESSGGVGAGSGWGDI